jgi:hypothetical protein
MEKLVSNAHKYSQTLERTHICVDWGMIICHPKNRDQKDEFEDDQLEYGVMTRHWTMEFNRPK